MTQSYARAQYGQSTTEFVILAAVLVPLFLLVPLIGKYIDTLQTTEAASRYVAFEGAARNSSNSWKTDAEVANEVRRRFFSNSNAPIKTNDVAGDFSAHRNPLWTDHRGNAFIQNFAQDVSVRTNVIGKEVFTAEVKADIPSKPAQDFLGGLGGVLTEYTRGFGLSNQNYSEGQVSIRLRALPNFPPFDKINLTTTRKTVLLVDAWTAKSVANVQSRIESAPIFINPMDGELPGIGELFPGLPTKPRDAFEFLGKGTILLTDPRPPDLNAVVNFANAQPPFRPGLSDFDIVPCDRLKEGCP
jgi:hypothetical protein